MKKILITGAAGFIGTNLIQFLQGQKVTIIGIDNFDPYYSEKIKKHNLQNSLSLARFSFKRIDLREKSQINILRREEISDIIHLAARPGVRASFQAPEEHFANNFLSTKNLLEFSESQRSVEKIIFASSSSVYGNSLELPWKESTKNLTPNSPYSKSKLACENLGLEFSSQTKKKFIVLRLFSVYGNYMRPDLAISKFTKSIINGNPITIYGDGSSKRDYTHISDVLNAILLALEFNEANFEIFNIGCQNPTRLKEVIDRIEILTGKKSIRKYVPRFRGECEVTSAHLSKSRDLLNYRPRVRFARGIKSYIHWVLRSGGNN